MRQTRESGPRLNAASEVARCIDCGRPIRPESRRCRFHAAAIARLAWKRVREELLGNGKGGFSPAFTLILLVSDCLDLADIALVAA